MSDSGTETSDSGRIEVRGLRVLGRHGANAEERSEPQPIEVDLDLHLDLRRAAETDDLEATVDYAGVVALAAETVRDESCQLLERLAHLIASRVAERHGLDMVTVAVRKLRPPLPADVSTVGVRVVYKAHP